MSGDQQIVGEPILAGQQQQTDESRLARYQMQHQFMGDSCKAAPNDWPRSGTRQASSCQQAAASHLHTKSRVAPKHQRQRQQQHQQQQQQPRAIQHHRMPATVGDPKSTTTLNYNHHNHHLAHRHRSTTAIENGANPSLDGELVHQKQEALVPGGAGSSASPTKTTTNSASCRGSPTTNADNQRHHYESGLMFNYSSLHGQYSSSQAHLQSLTSPNLSNSVTLQRKTPKTATTTTPNNNFIGRQQPQPQPQPQPRPQPQPQQQQQDLLHQYQSQQSLANTKPMMTSMLNEPSLSTATIGRHFGTGAARRERDRTGSIGTLTSSSNLAAAPTQSGANAQLSFPPPYSAATSGGADNSQQQLAICHQPSVTGQLVPGTSQQILGNETTTSNANPSVCRTSLLAAPASNANNNANSQLHHQHIGGSTSNSFPLVQSTATPSQQQQRIFNFLAGQMTAQQHQPQLQPPLPPNNFSPFSLQQYPLLHQTYSHHHHTTTTHLNSNDPLASSSAAANSFLQQRAQYSKSKSCLTCADISIKWYIVVIALLGLICALIGTIVGAVHSAGRDYISLALLLLGVGLVLVAISWIALRITINTYKSTGSPVRATAAPPPLGAQQQRHMPASQSALLNDRLYMVAAAAAAAQLTRQSQHQAATAAECQLGGAAQPAARAGQYQATTSLMSSIKRRLPRRLVRLISSSSGHPIGQHQDDSQPLAGAIRRQSPSGERRQSASPGAPPAAALAALLHQYQLLPPHHAAFLFPPPIPPPPIGHPFGLAHHLHDPLFRPPPPSYNASMQDQRLRMIMQERAALQRLQQHGAANGASSVQGLYAQPPPPSSVSHHSADEPQQQPGTQARANGPAANRSDEPAESQSRLLEAPPAATLGSVDGPQTSTLSIVNGRTNRPLVGLPARASCGQLKRAGHSTELSARASGSANRTLKSSLSVPSVAALVVANDIYVSSSGKSSVQDDQTETTTLTSSSDALAPPAVALSGTRTRGARTSSQASIRSEQQQGSSTIVNIGASETTVCRPATRHERQHEPEDQVDARQARRKLQKVAEVKILGYI